MINPKNKKLLEMLRWLLRRLQTVEKTRINVSQINYGRILSGKNIVVTGGGRGLGYYMAKKFLSEGANVVISGRNEKTLIDACNQLQVEDGIIDYVVFDVENVNECDSFILKCKNLLKGKIDCFVSNAGINYYERDYMNVTKEGFDKQFGVNYRGNYFICKSFLDDKIKEKEEGCLIIISSETGDICYETPYGMTKASLNKLTQMLAEKVFNNGIRVNAIAPGGTKSDMTSWYTSKKDGNMERTNVSSGRIFLPEEVAEIACFLVSEASKCLTGQIIHTNAGNHLRPYWE